VLLHCSRDRVRLMEKKMNLTRTMSIKEFCNEYRVGTTRLYEEVKHGRIRLRKLGRKSLISRDEAERWLKNLPTSGADRAPARRILSR
jgi:excisionase family DNA binding protein